MPTPDPHHNQADCSHTNQVPDGGEGLGERSAGPVLHREGEAEGEPEHRGRGQAMGGVRLSRKHEYF